MPGHILREGRGSKQDSRGNQAAEGVQASSLTGSLTRHFWFPPLEAPRGKRPSQPLATTLSGPGFKMCSTPLTPPAF